MFYKVGFYTLLAAVILCVGLFLKTNPMKTTGALSWVDIYSNAPAETIAFLNDSFGIKVVDTVKNVENGDYNVIKADGQVWPFAGVMAQPKLPDGKLVPAGSLIYLTVKDFDTMHLVMIENGAKSVAGKMWAGGMWFGVYEIPGGVTIGIAQYENAKNDK